ncbi:hypothetical protein CSUB01_12640 [Colletotrichum sublineola]|uniref:Uncharacterized protein n=1 Tax=Colletotrichum sublineola TaxID=1173701 RepID=A0A066XKC6_COLSU|nr:hypothetical protein CSUB01_12640 [Colletotrichum sublineola]
MAVIDLPTVVSIAAAVDIAAVVPTVVAVTAAVDIDAVAPTAAVDLREEVASCAFIAAISLAARKVGFLRAVGRAEDACNEGACDDGAGVEAGVEVGVSTRSHAEGIH